MCLSPFAHALQDVVSPSVCLLKVSSAAPRDEQGRGKNTSPDLGRQLHIPRKGLLGYTASLPSSPLQNQEGNSDPKSSLCKLSPGTPSRGRKKAAPLSLCQHSQDIPVLGLTLSNTPEEQMRRQLCHMQRFILLFRVLTSHCTVTVQSFFHPTLCSGVFMYFGLRRRLNLCMRLMQQSAKHLIYPRGDNLGSCTD